MINTPQSEIFSSVLLARRVIQFSLKKKSFGNVTTMGFTGIHALGYYRDN